MFSRSPSKRQQIESQLARGSILHMGLHDEKGFFIQPVSYGFAMNPEEVVLYFCAEKRGRKYEVYRQTPDVSVLIDHLSGNKIDVDHYAPCFESLRAQGTVREVTGRQKEKALFALLSHCGFDAGQIGFDNILNDPHLGFYAIELREIVTKKNV